jgi:PhoPQ-activated pathogenicity-related protein
MYRKTFFENPNDPTILLRLPMTKAVVRAMDALTEFASEFNYSVKKFMIAGGSKVNLTFDNNLNFIFNFLI